MEKPSSLHLEKTLLKGADRKTQIYGRSYNKILESLLSTDVSQALKDMKDLDLSALGLYLGKCLEQEINASIVQLIRQCLGIGMPEYFCRRDADFPWNRAKVQTSENRYVNLNDTLGYPAASDVLKPIPLGDATHALEVLSVNNPAFFAPYAFLTDGNFQKALRDLTMLRNAMAHSGNVINKKRVRNFFEQFQGFMKQYLPSLAQIKTNLCPRWDRDIPPVEVELNLGRTPETQAIPQTGEKPLPARDDANELTRLFEVLRTTPDDSREEILNDEFYSKLYGLIDGYDWLDRVFGENGKFGVKNAVGDVLVPPEYDEVLTIGSYDWTWCTAIAVRKNGKCGLVLRDGGKPLTEFIYDSLGPLYSWWLYKKDNLPTFGLMSQLGKELTPCIMDAYYDPSNGILIFRRGDRFGLYSLETGHYIPPEYDKITWVDNGLPFVFKKDGIDGYVGWNKVFVPLADINAEEMDEANFISDFGE